MMIDRLKKWWRKQRIEMSSNWVDVGSDYYQYIAKKKPEAFLVVTQKFSVYKNLDSGNEVAISMGGRLSTSSWHWGEKPEIDGKEAFVSSYSEVFW